MFQLLPQASVLLLVILLFKVAPKHGAEVLSNVSKCRKTLLCITEKILVLDKLCSGKSSSAIGHEDMRGWYLKSMELLLG